MNDMLYAKHKYYTYLHLLILSKEITILELKEGFYMSKRDLLKKVFEKQSVERIPVGFWFHFLDEKDMYSGVDNIDMINGNIQGHKEFYKNFNPDFIKIMSDGFFGYPNDILLNLTNAKQLYDLKPIDDNHPWIEQQVQIVKAVVEEFGKDVFTFYNIFAPTTYLKLLLHTGIKGNEVLADLIEQDKDAVAHAIDIISKDIAKLVERIIRDAGADGIYFSVQNIQDSRVGLDLYSEIVRPGEELILSVAKKYSPYNILHICGYEGATNEVSYYKDYDAPIINWAVTVENLSLKDGKKIFDDKVVIGGFNNTDTGLLYTGTEEEIKKETKKIISDVGKVGVILGADCTVPGDIDLNRLEWVREAAHL